MLVNRLEFKPGGCGVVKATIPVEHIEITVLMCDNGTFSGYVLDNKALGSKVSYEKNRMSEDTLGEWLDKVQSKYGAF